MKAEVIHEFGDFKVYRYEDIETPKPKDRTHLRKVLAAGVNRLDHCIREGSVAQSFLSLTSLAPTPSEEKRSNKR